MCPSVLIAWGGNVRNKSFGAGRGQKDGEAGSLPASSAVQEMHARKIPGTGVAQTMGAFGRQKAEPRMHKFWLGEREPIFVEDELF